MENFEDISKLQLSDFKFFLFSLNNLKLCLVSSNQILIFNNINESKDLISQHLQTQLVFSEELGSPNCINWLTNELLCIGFDTGKLLFVEEFGNLVCEKLYEENAIQSVKCCKTQIDDNTILILYENNNLILVIVLIFIIGL